MAAPKPNPRNDPDPDDFWSLPPDGSANVMDDERWERLLKQPGVIVRQRDPDAPTEPFVPTSLTVPGSMSLEDLLRLLGRRDDDTDFFTTGTDDDLADR